jgi:hypothetical protein
VTRRDSFMVAAGLTVGAITGLGMGEQWVGVVALCAAMLACGLGMVIGAQQAREALTDTHAFEQAIASRFAYEQGYIEGIGACLTPAPPERPYDIEADR